MASGMSWLGWHRSNLGLRQGAMNMNNPSVTLSGEQPYFPGQTFRGKVSWGFKNKVTVKGRLCHFSVDDGYVMMNHPNWDPN